MYLKTLQVVRDLGPVGKGASNAHYFLCEDANEYVVKFMHTQHGKTVINELVGSSLALKIKLPTPDVVLVNLSEEIVTLSDDLKKRNIQPGIHVGILRLPKDALDFSYLTDDMLLDKNLINNDELYGVINFDNWLINTDRNNPGNNMIEFLPDNKMRFVIIDFGHCFTGPSWNTTLQESKSKEEIMSAFPFILRRLIGMNGFENWFNEIENLNDTEVDVIVSSIPNSWNLTDKEKEVLLDFIKHRKKLVRKIICDNKVKLNLDH